MERLGTKGQSPRRALILTLARGDLLEQRPAWGSSGGSSGLIRLETLSRDEAAAPSGQTPPTVPPAVKAASGARLDALPPRLRDLARRASTFKYGFGFPDLQVIDPDATIEEGDELEDAEMLVGE